MFDILLADQNQTCILGLSSNLFYMMRNISILVCIIHRGHGWECGIYELLIKTNICMGITLFCGRDG